MTLREKEKKRLVIIFLGPLAGWLGNRSGASRGNTTEQDAGGQGHHTTPGQTDTRKDDMQMHTRRHPLTHTHTRHDATYHVNCRAKAKKSSPSSSSSLFLFTSPALEPATLPLFFKRKSVAPNQKPTLLFKQIHHTRVSFFLLFSLLVPMPTEIVSA